MGLFDKRTTRLPLEYPWAIDYIRSMQRGFWTDEEFNFLSDIGQYKQLPEKLQKILDRSLVLISQVELPVKSFWVQMGSVFQHPEIYDLGITLGHSEVIHGMAYEKLVRVRGQDHLFEEMLQTPVVKARLGYLTKHLEKKYTEDKKQYLRSIILFTLFVENASLFSQFYTILHVNKTKGVLKDTAQQVMYTRSEEDVHRLVGIRLINTLREEYPELFDEELEEDVYSQTMKAIEAENNVIDWLLEGYSESGLNAPTLKAFIKDRMAQSLKMIGFKAPEVTEVEEDLLTETEWFNVSQYGTVMADFFQFKPTEYQKHNRDYQNEDLWND